VISIRRITHGCNFDTYACEYDTQEYDYDTLECDYDTLECDLYTECGFHTQSVISTHRVWLPHAECDFYTQSVITTRTTVFLRIQRLLVGLLYSYRIF
jgi:hypothetical protein